MDRLIHRYKMCGYNIILDVNSNCVHIVNDLVYIMTGMLTLPLEDEVPERIENCEELSNYNKDLIHDAYNEILALYKDKMLFSELPELDKAKIDYDQMPIKSLCLHIAHDCNMRCEYCFASKGSYNRDRSLMSLEVGKKAIDFLLERSMNIKNLEIDFFGGEPLMNFDVVKKLVEYGRTEEKKYGKNIRFTTTTNGVLLGEQERKLLNDEMSNVILSVDGRREVNDAMRPMEDGSGSYDVIMPNFKKFVEERGGKDYFVRGTFTRKNLDFTQDVLSLAAEGFDRISVEPVVLDENDENSIRKKDVRKICLEYERLAKEIIKRDCDGSKLIDAHPFTFFHFMIDLDEGPCVYKKIKGCGSGTEYISITPNGDIYPCHQFAGDTDFKMGNIYDGKLDENIRRKFSHSAVTENPECSKCWARFFCGGGCRANNYKFNKDIEQPYEIGCQLERKRVECAILVKAAESFSRN